MTTTESPTVSEEALNNRRNWIHALESGEYEQGTGLLVDKCDGKFFHCCIGVECVTNGGSNSESLFSLVSESDNYRLFEKRMGLKWSGLGSDTKELTGRLISMNDERKRSFKFIARFLRVLWSIKD